MNSVEERKSPKIHQFLNPLLSNLALLSVHEASLDRHFLSMSILIGRLFAAVNEKVNVFYFQLGWPFSYGDSSVVLCSLLI